MSMVIREQAEITSSLRHRRCVPPAGGLGVLTADTDTPVVTEPAVGSDLLQALEILTELVVQKVREDLGGLAVLDVLLSVEEVVWDLVLAGVGDDGDNSLDLLLAAH